jgi:hypothetical protein
MQRTALTPALSRRERENISRGFRRVGLGVGWNGSRRLGWREFRHVAVRDMRHPLPPGEGWGEGARFNPRDGLRGGYLGKCIGPGAMPTDP